MKYLGIDYGKKRIGLSISSEDGSIAFPKEIIINNKNIVQDVINIIKEEHIDNVVIGKSISLNGNDNLIQRGIDKFIKKLSQDFDGKIILQDERMSSLAAKSHLYGKGNIENKKWTGKENKKRRNHVDAGAAAIILQRYLDRQ